MSKQGYISLHRQIQYNSLWTSEPFTKAQAWIDILILTNHKEGEIILRNGEVVNISRGECGYSMLTLAERWRWSRGKVKRFFNYLIERKMIQQKDVSKTTIIKVLNYEKYQNGTTNNTTNDTTNSTTNDTLTIMNNNDNNVLYIDQPKKNKTAPEILISQFTIEYNKIFNTSYRITNLQKDKLIEIDNLLAESNEKFIDVLPNVLNKLSKIRFDNINFKPSASWLLKEDNFMKVLNGDYDIHIMEVKRARYNPRA